MAIAPSGFVVSSPKRPFIPKYGLLNAIGAIELDDSHAWAGGVEWEDELCTSVESFTDNCPPASGYTKSTERDLNFCHADPFIIKSSFDCSTGGRPVEDAFRIAKKRLLAWESYELERVFWTGLSANGQINPSLAFGNDTCEIFPEVITVSGPCSVVAGIASLEEALSNLVPGGGVIHAPFGLASFLAEASLLERVNETYFSPTGTPIVLGAGYPGSGPGNVVADAGTTWVFGTGPVQVWRNEVFMNPTDVSESINRYRNNITVFAERFYAVGFSCQVFAVQVCLV